MKQVCRDCGAEYKDDKFTQRHAVLCRAQRYNYLSLADVPDNWKRTERNLSHLQWQLWHLEMPAKPLETPEFMKHLDDGVWDVDDAPHYSESIYFAGVLDTGEF
jgi:hypothetical protein